MTKDAKIGLVSLVVAALLLSLHSLHSAGIVVFGRKMDLLFSQVSGLRAGDLVTIGGVSRGRVISIDFAPELIQERLVPLTGGVTLVRARVAFDDFRRIPQDSTYTVRSDLNGRRWVEITLSPSEKSIGPDDIFFAEAAPKQDDQLQATVRAFSTLGKQTEDLRRALADPNFALKTKDAASNLRFYSRELKAASAEAPAKLEEFEKNLDEQQNAILAELASLDAKAQNVRERMVELKPQLTENVKSWKERLLRQSDRFTQTLKLASERSGDYEALLNEALAKKLDPDKLRAFVLQVKKWSRKLDDYRALAEDLHALTSDPTVRSDLVALISKLKSKSAKLNEQVEKIEKRIDGLPLKSILGYPEVKPANPGITNPEDPLGSSRDEAPKVHTAPEAQEQDRVESYPK